MFDLLSQVKEYAIHETMDTTTELCADVLCLSLFILFEPVAS